jgi:putative oxidoreductase
VVTGSLSALAATQAGRQGTLLLPRSPSKQTFGGFFYFFKGFERQIEEIFPLPALSFLYCILLFKTKGIGRINARVLKKINMKHIPLLGRIFYSLIFILSGFNHFSQNAISYAASNGVPMANILVPFAGVLAFLGGLSILIGFRARLGAWLIVAFLVPVTLWMHRFWTVDDPMMRQMQMAMFMKNISMLGGALFIAYFGAGPESVDAHRQLPVKRTPIVNPPL